MDSASRPRSARFPLDRVLTLGLLIGALAYAFFLARHLSPYASGSDSSGYLNSARLLGAGRFFAAPRVPAGTTPTAYGHMVFQPLGFIMDPGAPRMAPTYPPGLPLHLLLAARLGGWDQAVGIVNLLAALAGGGLVWLLGRHLQVSPIGCALAVGLLWLCPLYLFYALQPMGDLTALVWSLAALYAALHGRGRPAWMLGCGAALAVAVLVRPTNVLLALPLAFALWPHPRNYLLVGLGGLPGALFLAYYNHQVYGSALVTGYGTIENLFSPAYVPHNLAHMGRWIPALLSPLVVAALAAPWVSGPGRRDLRILAGWAALLVAFYAFYFHTGEKWWYLRFVLPAFPVLILGFIIVLERLPRPSGGRKALLVAGAVALAAAWETTQIRRLNAARIVESEVTYPLAADWARSHLPPDSAVFCMQVSGSLFYYTDLLVVRWDMIDDGRVAPLFAQLQAGHRPLYAILFPFEIKDALARLGGEWTQIGEAGQATVWRRKG